MKKAIRTIFIAGIFISSLCITYFGIASPTKLQTERYKIICLLLSLIFLGATSAWAFWRYVIITLLDKNVSRKKKKLIVFSFIVFFFVVASLLVFNQIMTKESFDRSEVIGSYISNFHEFGLIQLREDGTYLDQITFKNGEITSRTGKWNLMNINGESHINFDKPVGYIPGLHYGATGVYVEKPFWGRIRLVFGSDEGFYYIKRN